MRAQKEREGGGGVRETGKQTGRGERVREEGLENENDWEREGRETKFD